MIDWDPEIDAPAAVIVVGAGPIGIETALYARFLGYDVQLIDHGKVAGNVLKWGHLKMFTPFHRNSTSLGLAALRAQEPDLKLPDPNAYLTGQQYANEYLVPLAKTDLIYDGVHVHSRIVSISRVQSQKDDLSSGEERGGDEFRVLIDSKSRGPWTARADIIIDTTGSHSLPRGLAPGGGSPIEPAEADDVIKAAWLDVSGKQQDSLRGKHVLMFGSGLEAAHLAIALEQLSLTHPETKLSWVTLPDEDGKPALRGFECAAVHSPSTELNELYSKASGLLKGASPAVVPIAAWGIERISRVPTGALEVTLLTGFEETLARSCDLVIRANGMRPQWDFVDALRIERCGQTDGPKGCAAITLQSSETRQWSGTDLLTTEPHYYVLGSKSFGCREGFLLHDGYQQIRSLFALIGGRADLDLYQRASFNS